MKAALVHGRSPEGGVPRGHRAPRTSHDLSDPRFRQPPTSRERDPGRDRLDAGTRFFAANTPTAPWRGHGTTVARSNGRASRCGPLPQAPVRRSPSPGAAKDLAPPRSPQRPVSFGAPVPPGLAGGAAPHGLAGARPAPLKRMLACARGVDGAAGAPGRAHAVRARGEHALDLATIARGVGAWPGRVTERVLLGR